MGGIREKGFFLNCDRCGKDKEIVEEKQIEFYKKFRDRKDRSHTMFMSMLIGGEGEKVASFEWLCPECHSAIATYLGKAAPEKGEEASKTAKAPKEPKAAKAVKETPPPAPVAAEAPPAAAEPDRDAAPTPAADEDEGDGDDSVDDNELFD
jgi:DNA-directed RNA polymerase subunit M/transcription elongation factor TFIIS